MFLVTTQKMKVTSSFLFSAATVAPTVPISPKLKYKLKLCFCFNQEKASLAT